MSKLKIAVLASGNGSNLQALIDAIADGTINGQLSAVISDRADAYALTRASKCNILAICVDKKAYKDRKEFDLQVMKSLEEIQPELIVLAGYLSILSAELIDKYRGKIINIHPSLLPAFGGKGFYGDKVHKAVIESGAKVSGATVHFVDEDTDTGPIILQKSAVVLYGDTPETLSKRILAIEHYLIVKAVKLFCENRLSLDGLKVKIL